MVLKAMLAANSFQIWKAFDKKLKQWKTPWHGLRVDKYKILMVTTWSSFRSKRLAFQSPVTWTFRFYQAQFQFHILKVLVKAVFDQCYCRTGVNFLPQTSGLPKHTFVSFEVVHWAIENVDGIDSINDACVYLEVRLLIFPII